jgi:S-adenosyl-L-methionine hydrolase (adenosine-forming)
MIALFTDFGLTGPYTGQVKAVLVQQAPGVPVVDLFADAPPGSPKPSAYLLAAYGPWFPPQSVLLSVVDPGVGSERRAVVVEADSRFYVGPDNGLFELVLRRARGTCCYEVQWRPETLSASFHGRDLFAPVAAQLALSGPDRKILRRTEVGRIPEWPDDLSEIVYVDHYGNAMTGLRASTLPATASLVAGDRILPKARTFSDVPLASAFWYENANGLAEISVNGSRADTTLGIAIGSPVAIHLPIRL